MYTNEYISITNIPNKIWIQILIYLIPMIFSIILSKIYNTNTYNISNISKYNCYTLIISTIFSYISYYVLNIFNSYIIFILSNIMFIICNIYNICDINMYSISYAYNITMVYNIYFMYAYEYNKYIFNIEIIVMLLCDIIYNSNTYNSNTYNSNVLYYSIVYIILICYYIIKYNINIYYEYDNNILYNKIKEVIDDEQIRAYEYREILKNRNTNKIENNINSNNIIDNNSNVTYYIKYANDNCCFFIALYYISNYKILYLLCILCNSIINNIIHKYNIDININIKHIIYIIIFMIILNSNTNNILNSNIFKWEYLMLFYKVRGNKNIPFQYLCSTIL